MYPVNKNTQARSRYTLWRECSLCIGRPKSRSVSIYISQGFAISGKYGERERASEI